MTHERTMQQLLNTSSSNKRKAGSGGSARLGDGSLPRLRPNPNTSAPTSPFLSPSSPASSSSISSSASSSPLFEDPFNDSDCEPLFASVLTYVGGASSSPSSSVAHATYHHFLPTSLSQMATTSTLRQRVGDEVCMDVSSNINSYTMTRTSIPLGKDELQQQQQLHHQQHEQGGGQGIFGLMDAKVRQLAQAVFEFNRALDTTALRPYFGDVGKQLQLMSQDTNKRLSEVSTYYSWLRQHNTPIGATPAGYFSILPEELNMYILSFLNVRELASVERVSRYWRRLAEDDQIWQSMHRARWGRDAHGLLIRQMSFEGSGSASDSGEEEAQCQAESRRAKRKRRGWKDIYIDGNRLEKNWKGGKYSTKLVKRSVQAQESAYCIKFDDHRMVTGSNDRCVRLSDIKSGHVLHTLAGHTAEVRSVDFDTTKIASGSRDRAVKVWDINTGQCLLSMDDHAGPVKCMQMTDNIIMSGSEDASIKMLDLNSGKVVNTFNGHVWGVACLQFKDNYIVSGSRDRRVFLWDKRITPSHIASDAPKQCLRVMEGHSNTVRCVAFNEETIVSGSWDNTIKVWSTKTGKLKNTLDGHDGRVLHLDFDQNKIVSGSVDKTVRVWWDYEATAAPPITYSLHMHQAPIFHVRFNDYGIRSAARDTELIEWDFYTPSLEDVHKTRRALLRPI